MMLMAQTMSAVIEDLTVTGNACPLEDGPNHANVVINSSPACCSCCARCARGPHPGSCTAHGKHVSYNKSLPHIPPALVGVLDDAAWAELLGDLRAVGARDISVGEKIKAYLTCTCCCAGPAHLVLFEARLVATIEKHDALLKKAGVLSMQHMSFHYEEGGQPATLPYVRIEVAPKSGAPTMQQPSAQAMSPAEAGQAGVTMNPLHAPA